LIATAVTLTVLLMLHPLESIIERRFGAGKPGREKPPPQ
jgi:hypothetical protein